MQSRAGSSFWLRFMFASFSITTLEYRKSLFRPLLLMNRAQSSNELSLVASSAVLAAAWDFLGGRGCLSSNSGFPWPLDLRLLEHSV